MKKVLIISPHFPPANTADMQRIRQSLPYFRQYGWEPTIITVDEKYLEAYSIDNLLLQTFPADIVIHKVAAFKASTTRRFGIGSLSMRSYWQIQKRGDELLKREKFDLVYFSTTAFHVMALGPRWKKKFGVPFILDIQDPWYNTFYFEHALQTKSIKARLYHKVDQWLEAKTIPAADGIISVSEGYRDLYTKRYKNVKKENFSIIPFGCSVMDFDIAEKNVHDSRVQFSKEHFNILYIGRGGHDMEAATDIMFDVVAMGLKQQPHLFNKIKIWFIGTSYAQAGQGIKTIQPKAEQKGLGNFVIEITDRLPHFETLFLLNNADMLFVPGSTDPTYTASKIYAYIYSNKPLLAIFHKNSSVCDIIETTSTGKVVRFADKISEEEKKQMVQEALSYLINVLEGHITDAGFKADAFLPYTAQCMTKKQVDFFEKTIEEN